MGGVYQAYRPAAVNLRVRAPPLLRLGVLFGRGLTFRFEKTLRFVLKESCI